MPWVVISSILLACDNFLFSFYSQQFEDYPKGQGVIDEEDEGSSVSSRWVSGRGYRPSSAGSLKSTQSTERLSKRRVSSAGKNAV